MVRVCSLWASNLRGSVPSAHPLSSSGDEKVRRMVEFLVAAVPCPCVGEQLWSHGSSLGAMPSLNWLGCPGSSPPRTAAGPLGQNEASTCYQILSAVIKRVY